MAVKKIEYTDTLRQGADKINAAIDQSNEAIEKATTADANASQALATANNVQTQLNTIVIEGDSSVEAAQARVDADGTVFTTLKERLDTKETYFRNIRPVITPFEFGAVGDGVTNDTAAIQSCLDFAAANGMVVDGQGKTYVVRQLNVPSNSVIRNFRILQEIQSSAETVWELLAYVFYLKQVENVLLENIFIDGRRGEQYIIDATENSGKFGFNIRGAKNITIRNCMTTHMGTDGLNIDSFTDTPDVYDVPKNILIENCVFDYSRRNACSILDGDGITFRNVTFSNSGTAVAGSNVGANPIVGWVSPGVDIEPESNQKPRNIKFERCRFINNGEALKLYVRLQDTMISNVILDNCYFENNRERKAVAITSSRIVPVRVERVELYNTIVKGNHALEFFGVKNLILDGWTAFDVDGNILEYDFDGSADRRISIREWSENLIFKNVKVDNYGVVFDQYGSNPYEEAKNVVFDETCRLNSNFSNRNDIIVSRIVLWQERPIYSPWQPQHLFTGDKTRILQKPVFVSTERDIFPPGKDQSFIGWFLTNPETRKTTGAVPAGSTTIPVEAFTNTTIGRQVYLRYTDGRWYIGMITGGTSTSLEVSPALEVDVAAGVDVYTLEVMDMHAITQQPNIPNTSGASLSLLEAEVNKIKDALRKAHVLKSN